MNVTLAPGAAADREATTPHSVMTSGSAARRIRGS